MSTTTFTSQDIYPNVSRKKEGKKVDRDVILPFILLPLLLLIATVSSIITIIVMVIIGMGVLYVYSRPQQKNRSLFFFYWTISTFLCLYITYITEVVWSLLVTLLENVAVLVLIGCTLYFFHKMKRVADFELALGSSKGKEYSPMITSDSKYCHICQIEVNERFFHSIWWNCCIFRPNYPYFLAGNIFALFTLIYCTNISLTTICDNVIVFNSILVPKDCSLVYEEFHSSITFVSCIYGIGYICVIVLVLMRQLFVFIPKYSEPQWRRLKNVLNV